MDFAKHLKQAGFSANDVLVWAFIPFREDGFFGDWYDWKTTRGELDGVFRALGLAWRWQPVTLKTLPELMENVLAGPAGRVPLVLNYCDGDEKNGFPGLSVVRSLESAGIAFSGADSFFYELSSSKIRMKQMFENAGVSTAPFAILDDPEKDAAGLCERLGTPLIVKPSTGAARRDRMIFPKTGTCTRRWNASSTPGCRQANGFCRTTGTGKNMRKNRPCRPANSCMSINRLRLKRGKCCKTSRGRHIAPCAAKVIRGWISGQTRPPANPACWK